MLHSVCRLSVRAFYTLALSLPLPFVHIFVAYRLCGVRAHADLTATTFMFANHEKFPSFFHIFRFVLFAFGRSIEMASDEQN